MNELLQVITGVEFNCTTAMQGAHHIFFQTRLANEGLVNVTGDMGRELGLPAPLASCYPIRYAS